MCPLSPKWAMLLLTGIYQVQRLNPNFNPYSAHPQARVRGLEEAPVTEVFLRPERHAERRQIGVQLHLASTACALFQS